MLRLTAINVELYFFVKNECMCPLSFNSPKSPTDTDKVHFYFHLQMQQQLVAIRFWGKAIKKLLCNFSMMVQHKAGF